MTKPEPLTIQDLVVKLPYSYNGVRKRCRRAIKNNHAIIMLPGAGYYSVCKPGKEYLLYKIQADAKAKLKEEEKEDLQRETISGLMLLLRELVCDDCEEILTEFENKVCGDGKE
ncbi:MAG: hypothetical protein BBJ57_02010 [Desulfobacterales bacterium PC51MH44]|nr:MAG: hypothetical protein BBJ57_02010 [Desulfobacterales bacterium PC51MH44]